MISSLSHRIPRDSSTEHRSVARFKSVAASNQDAAELLLSMRKIAAVEVVHRGETNEIPNSPLPTSTIPEFKRCTLWASPSNQGANESGVEESARGRTVSIGSQEANVSPLAVVSPIQTHSNRVVSPPKFLSLAASSDQEDSSEILLPLIAQDKTLDDQALKELSARPDKKKLVGTELPDGVPLKDILRKKFSWKSFPELEAYLVKHRRQYLEYSNALNYTKAQKLYNNRLTQGLLDLAAQEGYIFEGFTFSAVRDRIRCFFKSYVQATKKKKRLKITKNSGW